MELSTDDGASWQPATLEREADPLSWRRWALDVALPADEHAVVVRATDGTGARQTSERTAPHPGGATGWHRIVVVVEGG